MSNAWQGRTVTNARAEVVTWLPAPCGKCGKEVTTSDRWVVGHKKSRAAYPELTKVVSNWQPEHRACSDRTGQQAVIEKAFIAGQKAALLPTGHPQTVAGPSLAHIYDRQPEPLVIREELTWPHHLKNSPDWLQPYLVVPDNASPPLAMTPVHPDATGSYGPQVIEWVKTELGITLRWWQALAFCMQLQHDKDGRLLIRTVVESGPRRIGKSVRLRSGALWRLDSADLFGEKQLALHTGKDVAIVREIHRQAWTWATERDAWAVKKGVGQEEVYTGDNRWLVRSTDSVYGYDVCLGMVDEAWAVLPPTFEEGIEPATMERIDPQNLLTSTAHRKATSLMRKKIGAALLMDDGETLLLLWGALPQDDPSKPETWRKASPHWSPEREKLIASKYAAALAGQEDAEADDPDPMAGFLCQYLNVWPLAAKAVRKGEAVVEEADWDALETEVGERIPDAAAVEQWAGESLSVAFAWRDADAAVVQVIDVADVATAAVVVKSTGYKGVTLVGASMVDDPAFKTMRRKSMSARKVVAAQDLARMLSDGVLLHDGSETLREQALALRTVAVVDGVRLVSAGRADAVKAAVWAAAAARAKPRAGRVRVITANGVV